MEVKSGTFCFSRRQLSVITTLRASAPFFILLTVFLWEIVNREVVDQVNVDKLMTRTTGIFTRNGRYEEYPTSSDGVFSFIGGGLIFCFFLQLRWHSTAHPIIPTPSTIFLPGAILPSEMDTDSTVRRTGMNLMMDLYTMMTGLIESVRMASMPLMNDRLRV